jgi:anti-sigma regulatory factor (Ser/Thr protein kinase)
MCMAQALALEAAAINASWRSGDGREAAHGYGPTGRTRLPALAYASFLDPRASRTRWDLTVTGTAVMSRTSQTQTARPWWSVCLQLDLAALDTAPGCGRGWIRAVLREWERSEELIELAELFVSELVTNAMRASVKAGAPAFRLAIATDRHHVMISVRDFAPGAPAPRRPGDDEDSGRGLWLVSELAERLGWEPSPDGGPGKVVWVVL